MLTAIILNWKRPENIPKILLALRQCDLVDEIIIWNNNPEIKLALGEDVCVINSSRDLGLFTRFSAALLAKNDGILFQDDDVVLDGNKIRQLYKHWQSDPEVCHAAFGRRCAVGPYNKINAWGDVDVVLTKAVVVHKKVCLQAAVNTQYVEDIPGKPVGNGEDILLSYTAMSMSGKYNRAHNLFLVEEKQDSKIAISQREPTHMVHRDRILKRCQKLFASPRKPYSDALNLDQRPLNQPNP